MTTTFTAGFMFCGLGAGARGFLRSRAHLGTTEGRFRSVGGIDIDAEACADFRRLTDSPATVADVSQMTPRDLRAAWGDHAPDAVFLSPPCKGFSGLLPKASAEKPEYQALNRLVLQGVWLLLETWTERPPKLIVVENVPRIVSRGGVLLAQVRDLLTRAGYRIDEGPHECGEVGGLAQRRRRYLLVARHEAQVPAYVYRPPLQRVRGCGEVLQALPVPIGQDARDAGPLHTMPRLAPITWERLAAIPAGGDWRDLPGTVEEGAQRRSVWARYDVRAWTDPARTVAGAGSNGGFGVADPRPLALGQTAKGADSFKGRPGLMRVNPWESPVPAVTGSASVSGSNGTAAVADPRLALGCRPRAGAYGVLAWHDPSQTVTGVAQVDNGPFAVADPRDLAHPVIIAGDGTWHRPMTALELAALQGLPDRIGRKPLQLAGTSRLRWVERIGNAVPVGTAEAIGNSLLLALIAGALGTWTLGSTGIWVRNDGRLETEWRAEA